MSSKPNMNFSKSTKSETPNNKASPATPINKATRKVVSKSSRGTTKSETDSPSPLQPSRLSVDHSPRSVTSKTSLDRRSPKLSSTTPDKQVTNRVLKGSELQAQLNLVQEECKAVKEKLAVVEKEKLQSLDELKEAQRLAEEADGKLREALVAQKRAEEDSEIEKFRAVEMEQAGIEASRKKEEEWQKELEAVRNQRALDASALLSATQELQKVKQELATISDAKNLALSHADDATKTAEIHAEKFEIVSAELVRLKTMLDSRTETEANDNNQMVLELNSEIAALKQELEIAKVYETEASESRRIVLDLKSEVETMKQELEIAKDYEKEASESRRIVLDLKSEVETMKQELEIAKDYEKEASESRRIVLDLKSEVETMKQELEKAKDYDEKLAENEAYIEQLNVELEAAKMAESYAHNLMEEWQKRVEGVEAHAEQTNKLERSASESLGSVMKQLEESNDLLHDAESEIASLKEKVGLLEMSIGSQRSDLEESERRLNMAKREVSELAKRVDCLMSELDIVKEEKTQALNYEKLAATSVQTLLEEKNKLINELEMSRHEEEQSKKAMESLASALHEVSSEAREAKEKLLSSQDEHENFEIQIENLKLVLEASNGKHENMLDDAKHEIDILTNLIEQSKLDYQNAKAEWEQKELHLIDCVNKFEEENSLMAKELSRLVNSLKEAEEEVCATKGDKEHLKSTVREFESEVNYLKEVLGDAKAESMRLKESLLDKENDIQTIIQENEELRAKESDSSKKVEELSKLLEEAKAKSQAEEDGNLTDSETDYDMLPKVVEFSEQYGDGKEVASKLDLPTQRFKELMKEIPLEGSNVLLDVTVGCGMEDEDFIGKPKEDKDDKEKEEDSVEVEFKMWESCKIEDKDFSPERDPENESVEDVDPMTESSVSFDQINGSSSTENLENGGSSPSKEQSLKKKKPLLLKFGSLLKKKGTSNQK